MNPSKANIFSWQGLCLKQVVNKTLSMSLVTTMAIGTFITPAWGEKIEENSQLEDNPKATVDQVWQIINNEYVDKDFNQVDWLEVRQELLSQRYTNQKQAYKAIRDAIKKLDDPYTRFLAPNEFENLTNQTTGELSGVGIVMKIDKRSNALVVIKTINNSPAIQAGIKAGDIILRIDGKPTALMTLEQASEAMRGEIGTEVSLQIGRNDIDIFEVSVKREHFEIPSVNYALKEEGTMRVGYIRLDEFSSHAAEQMEKAIRDLQKQQANAFVLDLRGNPGGLLFASVDIARMWMEKGAIVQTIDRLGGDRKFLANGTALTNLPLVVLVDKGSASASEILAGALKENKRAIVIGTPTFGKSTVQAVHSLTDGSGLAVTISRYYPPSGINIYKKGIEPDIYQEVNDNLRSQLNSNPRLIGTISDPQYVRAITYLKTATANNNPSPSPVSIR